MGQADDVEWTVPRTVPHGGSFLGRDGVGEFFSGLAEKWDGLDIDIEAVVDDGEHAVGIGRSRGTLRGAGESGYGFTHVFTVRDGRVVRFREYVDVDAPLG
jgi:ketosteroid isomerase-like protein